MFVSYFVRHFTADSTLGYFLIKSLIEHNKTQGVAGKSALDITKERYVKGEITKEDLEEIKKNL